MQQSRSNAAMLQKMLSQRLDSPRSTSSGTVTLDMPVYHNPLSGQDYIEEGEEESQESIVPKRRGLRVTFLVGPSATAPIPICKALLLMARRGRDRSGPSRTGYCSSCGRCRRPPAGFGALRLHLGECTEHQLYTGQGCAQGHCPESSYRHHWLYCPPSDDCPGASCGQAGHQ